MTEPAKFLGVPAAHRLHLGAGRRERQAAGYASMSTFRGVAAMMWALVVLAIYLVPFLIFGAPVKFLLDRYVVNLNDVQSQAGPNRSPRKIFLLGAWRTEK